jgi:hypothetical protein
LRRLVKLLFVFWVARWLGREIAARLESKHGVVE